MSSAVAHALRGMRARLGGNGGAICLDPLGGLGIAYSTERMAWAMRDAEGGSGGVASKGSEDVQVIQWR